MQTIESGTDVWTVIVTVDSDAQTMPVLERHARFGLDRFPDFEGFVSGALHVSEDGTRLVQCLQWRTEADYVACRDDSSWDAEPTAVAFMEAIDSGKASVDARGFKVVATSA